LHGQEFNGLYSLQYLGLYENPIKNINPRTFHQLPELVNLDLYFSYSYSSTKLIHKILFEKNLKLRSINLERNDLTAIHPDTFKRLKELETLNLLLNECVNEKFQIQNGNLEPVIESLSQCFENYLKDARNCSFVLESNLEYVCVMNHISVDKIGLFNIIGDHLENKSDLDVVSIIFKNSKLSKVPPEIFTFFENLKSLTITSVGIEDLNPLENCEKLTIFEALRNKISVIKGESFENCGNLKHINLRNNVIQNISSNSFEKLGKLEYLDLSYNSIGSIHFQLFKNCDKLRNLNFENNRIKFIEENTFESLQNLNELNLNYNTISKINPMLFQKLINLEKLHLSGNQIEFLENSPFESLENLREIYLSLNELTVLKRAIFQENKKLEKIYLSFNNIFKIHPETFDKFSSIKIIDLTDNVCVDKFFEIYDGDLVRFKNELTICFANYLGATNLCNFHYDNIMILITFANTKIS
jgi:Leucine-rich repeat (LRR) protein